MKEIAGARGMSIHVARHTFAMLGTLVNGIPIETISKMLGHTSLKAIQIYSRIVDSKIANDMKQLIDVLQ